MKKSAVLLLVISLLSMSLIAGTFPRERIGESLDLPLGGGTLYFEENTPFHMAHGWAGAINFYPTNIVMRVQVRLVVDGVEIEEDFVEHYLVDFGDYKSLFKMYVFNFPEGMSGTHVFDIYYTETCELWEYYGYVPECEKKSELMEIQLKSWEVVFE